MTRIPVLLVVLTTLLWATRCSQPETEVFAHPKIAEIESFAVTPDEAAAEALEARKALAPATRSQAVAVSSVARHAASAAASDPAQVDPSLYVVNFADQGGFAIVAADRRQHATVYAVSDRGAFPDPATLEDGTLKFLFRQIETLAAAPTDPGVGTALSGGYVTGVWKDTKRVSPLVEMRWGMGVPFNQWEDVTALCQIMSYHEWPAWYDWETIKSLVCAAPIFLSDSVRDAKITQLFADVDAKRSSSLQQWLEALNYQCDASEPYRYELIVSQIDRRRPVYATGFTHLRRDVLIGRSWVMDGYLEQTRTFYPLIDPVDPDKPGWGKLYAAEEPYTETRTLVHCNLCDDGRGNGYYLSTLFSRSGAVIPDEGVLPDYNDGSNDTLTQVRITPNIRRLIIQIPMPPKS